jgi:hypothetical protein
MKNVGDVWILGSKEGVVGITTVMIASIQFLSAEAVKHQSETKR